MGVIDVSRCPQVLRENVCVKARALHEGTHVRKCKPKNPDIPGI